MSKNSGAKGTLITIELVAFVILAVYLTGYTASMLNKPKIGVETITFGQIDIPRQYDGIILRDESVTVSNDTGAVIYSYGDNEYVKKGSLVCVVRNDGGLDLIEREIEAINDDIISRQAQMDELPAHTEEIRRINTKMKTEINGVVPLFIRQGGTAEVYQFKTQLQKDIDTRNGVLLSDTDGAFSELADKRMAYEKKLLDGTGSYTAERGGVLSYSIDGFESVFTPEAMMNISQESIASPSAGAMSADRRVTPGSPLFKIVNSNTWYLCAYFDNEIAHEWKERSSRYIYFGDAAANGKVMMRIEAIERKEGKTYVVFSSSKYMLDFINKRNIKFSLEDDTFKGLKIPNAAITEKTALYIPSKYISERRGSTGVYVSDDNGFSFKRVNILSQGDGGAYVLQDFNNIKLGAAVYLYEDGGINENDSYIVSDLKTVQGAYIANSGTAEFRQVNIINKNTSYSIVENSLGRGIKSYDTIVSDASAVDDNQIIR